MTPAWPGGIGLLADGQRALRRMGIGAMKPFRFDRFTALLAAVGVLGTALVLLRTNNYGAAIAGDSLLYLSVAENLLDGNGFVKWNTKRIYLDGAPLFPLALAGVGLFGVEVLEAARYLDAAAFGLTVFVTALWLRRRVSSRFLVLWGVGACALRTSLADLSAYALTEPLFILFTTLSLFSLDRFLDSRQRSLLLAAALCAGMAWATRYIGVTVVASALLVLLLQGGMSFPARVRNAALYAVVAGAPIGIWMLRNLLHTGGPLGVVYPKDFSLLSSLHIASGELIRWALGDGIARFAIAGFDREASGTAGLSLRIGVLLAAAFGVGYALVRLRRRGYAQDLGIWAVPVSFASIYGVFLTFHLPLTGVNLPRRYLAPLYVPALVSATLFLNEALRGAGHTQPFAKPHFARKWSDGSMTTASWPALALTACLSLWLLPQGYGNYRNIQDWLDNGRGYTSKRWVNSSTIRYVDNHLHDEYVWSNGATSIQFLVGASGRTNNRLPYARPTPDNLRRWLGIDDWTSQFDPYIVWFHRVDVPRYDYDLAELAALPGVQVEAILDDGVVFKAVGARIGFDVSYDENEHRLIYVKEECRAEDLEAPVFLHLFPTDKADLPDHRRQYAFDNLDFYFDGKILRSDGRCVAERRLPDYAIDRVRTGQHISGEGPLWTGEFRVAK